MYAPFLSHHRREVRFASWHDKRMHETARPIACKTNLGGAQAPSKSKLEAKRELAELQRQAYSSGRPCKPNSQET